MPPTRHPDRSSRCGQSALNPNLVGKQQYWARYGVIGRQAAGGPVVGQRVSEDQQCGPAPAPRGHRWRPAPKHSTHQGATGCSRSRSPGPNGHSAESTGIAHAAQSRPVGHRQLQQRRRQRGDQTPWATSTTGRSGSSAPPHSGSLATNSATNGRLRAATSTLLSAVRRPGRILAPGQPGARGISVDLSVG